MDSNAKPSEIVEKLCDKLEAELTMQGRPIDSRSLQIEILRFIVEENISIKVRG